MSAVTLGLLLVACSKKAGDSCSSDDDCKRPLVCADNKCTDPNVERITGSTEPPTAATPPPTPAPTPDPTPTPITPVAAQPAADPPPTTNPVETLIVNPPTAFATAVVRSSPSLSAPQSASLSRGTEVTPLETSADGQFRRVRWTVSGGGEGWLHRDVVSAPGVATKVSAKRCSRQGQFCLLDDNVTAGVCMDFGGLVCATPVPQTHHDGCGKRRQGCRCGSAAGVCETGSAKEGLYCQCAAPASPTPVNDPRCGCKRDGIIYEKNGNVWGCEGGGNWCASSGRLVGGCPKRPGC